ncbi:predicted protein [Histoplasma capsulatum var. duboisii H88]|uniref:Predicted protein n=1 Tax=Ajellomyces capsulatus (strain H88) TaxID=544711 RepID=F0UMP4_AJEC8|nr:predicted protein [Histoplasma capsulatum var. duboisii H88]
MMLERADYECISMFATGDRTATEARTGRYDTAVNSMPKPYNTYQVQTFGVRPSLLQIANPNSNLSLRTISPVLLLLLLLDSFGLCLRGSKQSKPRTFQRKKVQLRNFALPLFVWCHRPSSAFHTRPLSFLLEPRTSSSDIVLPHLQ